MKWTAYTSWWTLDAGGGRIARLYPPATIHPQWEVCLMNDEFRSGEYIELDAALTLAEAKAIAQTLLGALT
jgi:hypothetical protein